jgi:hypothetical protein
MKDQMTYRGFLAELLMADCDDGARPRSERRIKTAGFRLGKSLKSATLTKTGRTDVLQLDSAPFADTAVASIRASGTTPTNLDDRQF